MIEGQRMYQTASARIHVHSSHAFSVRVTPSVPFLQHEMETTYAVFLPKKILCASEFK